jgi:hypothetical protein
VVSLLKEGGVGPRVVDRLAKFPKAQIDKLTLEEVMSCDVRDPANFEAVRQALFPRSVEPTPEMVTSLYKRRGVTLSSAEATAVSAMMKQPSSELYGNLSKMFGHIE